MKRKSYGPTRTNLNVQRTPEIKSFKKAKKINIEKDELFHPGSVHNIGKPVSCIEVPKGATSIPYPYENYKGRCYWDHHTFKGPAVACPIDYDFRRKKFKVTGAFCSYNCALSWGEHSELAKTRKNCALWLRIMLRDTRKEALKKAKDEKEKLAILNESIKRAPDIKFLKAYGGNQTIEEYRAKFNHNLDHLSYFPLVRVLPVTWQLWEVDRSVEVSRFSFSTGKGSAVKGKSMTELGTTTTTKRKREEEKDPKTNNYSDAIKKFKSKRGYSSSSKGK